MAAPLSQPGAGTVRGRRRSTSAAPPRPPTRRLFERFGAGCPAGRGASASTRRCGMRASASAAPRPFAVDVVPRIIARPRLGGLERRPRSSGSGRSMRSSPTSTASAGRSRRGWCRSGLIETADRYEPAVAGNRRAAIAAPVAGPDLLRAPDGTFLVARGQPARAVGPGLPARRPPGSRAAGERVRAARRARSSRRPRRSAPRSRAAAPAGVEQPRVVLDQRRAAESVPSSSTRRWPRRFGMSVAAPPDLRRRGERLLLGDEPVDVVYRRVDDERLTAADGSPTALGRAARRAAAQPARSAASTRPAAASPTTRRSTSTSRR